MHFKHSKSLENTRLTHKNRQSVPELSRVYFFILTYTLSYCQALKTLAWN
nr:MAG TPA: hypothetical protein [Caudoviricetes sp.]